MQNIKIHKGLFKYLHHNCTAELHNKTSTPMEMEHCQYFVYSDEHKVGQDTIEMNDPMLLKYSPKLTTNNHFCCSREVMESKQWRKK